jgi:hypothetical protein
MTPEELITIKSLASAFGLGAILATGIAWLVIKYYLSSYLSEKGKNLATKEDIAGITDQVEAVRTQYSTLIEELKARHQLRLAAIDRRIQTHQEAFTLWRKLFAATHSENIGKVVIECQTWWEQNCIYLEPNVRLSFVTAYNAAHLHNSILSSRSDGEDVKANWAKITSFPNELFEAIQLPKLSELEIQGIGSTKNELKNSL